MRLANCRFEGRRRIAISRGETVDLLHERATDILALAADPAGVEAAIDRRGVSIEAIAFGLPVERPDKILCIGINYRDHAAEASAAAKEPANPSIFVRFPGSHSGHEQPIVAPAISEQFDFEGELGVIIGKPAWRISRADALSHVAGYCCFAENSVRDFQKHATQITAGKNFRSSGAFGPWLTTADEVGDPSRLTLVTRLNGAVMQSAALSSMIFPVDALIAYISQFTQLLPGDVIATGTPAGVGALRTPPVWMKPGDLLEIDIPGVGLLRNRVVAEDAIFPEINEETRS